MEADKEISPIVEIVGLAGAGKSTLTNELCSGRYGVIQGEDFYTPNMWHWLKYAGYCSRHLRAPDADAPAALAQCRDISREDIKKMLYLSGWHRILHRQRARGQDMVAVDQGFVFCLATLYGFGPPELKDKRYEQWWQRMFDHWAKQLDAIVWLDGPNDVLLDRVHKRSSFHVAKEMPDDEALQFLLKYRASYEYVVAAMLSRRPIKIMKFDTSQVSTEKIVSQLTGNFVDCGPKDNSGSENARICS